MRLHKASGSKASHQEHSADATSHRVLSTLYSLALVLSALPSVPAFAQVAAMPETVPAATLNYQIADYGNKFVVTPVCYFDTKGNRAKVKLDHETGRLMIKPRHKPRAKDINPNMGSQIYGGYINLPKKADWSKDPVVRHEGPVGQMLVIDIDKIPSEQTTPFVSTYQTPKDMYRPNYDLPTGK